MHRVTWDVHYQPLGWRTAASAGPTCRWRRLARNTDRRADDAVGESRRVHGQADGERQELHAADRRQGRIRASRRRRWRCSRSTRSRKRCAYGALDVRRRARQARGLHELIAARQGSGQRRDRRALAALDKKVQTLIGARARRAGHAHRRRRGPGGCHEHPAGRGRATDSRATQSDHSRTHGRCAVDGEVGRDQGRGSRRAQQEAERKLVSRRWSCDELAEMFTTILEPDCLNMERERA